MSEVVTGVVKLTFGFLAKKIRSGIAERLKDGDVTDEECRRLIVRELDDIKSKLDGLARKDLLSSLCFLQDGINSLYQSLLQFDSNENTEEPTEQATLVETASSRDTGLNSPISDVIALVNVITSLKIRSNERLKSATKSFELARENATKAFCNETLSMEDRIHASQIRMMARILENLEDPDASVSDCLQYLKQLHDIGAIQEIFSVLIDGGIKSRFNKKKRLNNASSVQVMNETLSEFARKFTKPSLLGLLNQWPLISLGEESYHPVCGEDRHVGKLKESGLNMSLCPDFTFEEKIHEGDAVVNSSGEIVVRTRATRTVEIFKRSGESRVLCEVPREEHASRCVVHAIGIDVEDNIYVITIFREGENEPWSFKLFIFDKNGNKKLESSLPFLQGSFPTLRMAVNKDGKITILNCETNVLYVGNVCIEQNSFKVDKSFSLNELYIQGNIFSCVNVRFSDCNETEMIAASNYAVYIYTENGQLQRKIKIPEGHASGIWSVAINHVTKRILVKMYKGSLLSFSETGELIDSLSLKPFEWTHNAELTSHPNGPVALVGETGAVLL